MATAQGAARVAIIGYGLSGAIFHAPFVHATSGLTVAAIVTGDPARRAQAAHDFPDAALLSTADALWADTQPYDLIVVATPNAGHLPLGLAALRSGAAVVVDKPFALTVADAETLIAASTAAGRPIVPFQNRRWDGDFLTVRRLVEGDWLGSVVHFESRMDRYRAQPRAGSWREMGDAALGGGLLYDLGSHLIDQAVQLVGPPQTVFADLGQRRPGTEVDDDDLILLGYDGGPSVQLHCTMLARTPGPRFVVRGLSGTFTKYGTDPQEDALRSGVRPDAPTWGHEDAERWGTLVTEHDGAVIDGRVQTLPGDYGAFYRGIAAMLHDGAPPPVLASDALLTQRIIAAAQRSAQEKAVIPL